MNLNSVWIGMVIRSVTMLQEIPFEIILLDTIICLHWYKVLLIAQILTEQHWINLLPK